MRLLARLSASGEARREDGAAKSDVIALMCVGAPSALPWRVLWVNGSRREVIPIRAYYLSKLFGAGKSHPVCDLDLGRRTLAYFKKDAFVECGETIAACVHHAVGE